MLDGKDYSKDMDALQKDNREVDGLKQAVIFADQQIKNLETMRDETIKEISFLDILGAGDGVGKVIVDCIEKLYEADESWKKVLANFEEVRKVAGKYHMSIAEVPELRELNKVYNALRFKVFLSENQNGLTERLMKIEDERLDTLREARSQHGSA